MPIHPPRVVCVDLGGVVVRICRSWKEGCEAAGVPHRESFDQEGHPTITKRAEAVDRYQRGLVSYRDFLAEVSQIFGGVYSSAEIGMVHDAWIRGDYPGIADLFASVRRAKIRVACLSNTNDSHWKQMTESSEAFRAIEFRHASHLIGLNKPDPAIFAAFERAMECEPHEILFADDLIANVQAAAARGWNAIHIDHTGDTAAQLARALAKCGVELFKSCTQCVPLDVAATAAVTVVAIDEMPSPLMSRTLGGEGSLGGIIKVRPGDFLVDELPLYEPSGEGEHLYLGIQKQDMDHDEMIRIVAAHYQVDPGSIGSAGRKDRRAVTRQTISVNLSPRAALTEFTHDRMVVLWSRRHANKIRTGHLIGNRFAIRVRNVDPLRVSVIHRRLIALVATGIPNGFGPQRFGQRLDNHRLGRMVLESNWDGIVKQMTCTTSPAFPEHQREARLKCDLGQWSQSLPLWGAGDHAERKLALAMSRGWTSSRAVKNLSGPTLRFWVHSLQSAIFNHVLDVRLCAQSLGQVAVGDVAFKHDSGACFVVDANEPTDVIADRAARMEISPTGPIFGQKMLMPSEPMLSGERGAAAAFGVSPELFCKSTHPPAGERRPLRIALTAATADSGVDEFGGYIRVAFDLPAGAFATVVLRELFGDSLTQARADEGPSQPPCDE